MVNTFTAIVGPVTAAGCYVVAQERDQPDKTYISDVEIYTKTLQTTEVAVYIGTHCQKYTSVMAL